MKIKLKRILSIIFIFTMLFTVTCYASIKSYRDTVYWWSVVLSDSSGEYSQYTINDDTLYCKVNVTDLDSELINQRYNSAEFLQEATNVYLSKLLGFSLADCDYIIANDINGKFKVQGCLKPSDETLNLCFASVNGSSYLQYCSRTDDGFKAISNSSTANLFFTAYFNSNSYFLSSYSFNCNSVISPLASVTNVYYSTVPVYLVDEGQSSDDYLTDDIPDFGPSDKKYIVDLEVPQNLKVSGQWLCKDTLNKTNHGQLKFSWDISEEVLKEYNINDIPWATTFDMYVKSKYCKNGALHLFDEWVESEKYLFQQQFATLYNVRSLHQDFGCKVPISSYTYSEGSTLLGGCSSSDFSVEPVACQFRIRNYYDDGNVIHISNWLVVYIDKDGDDDIIRIQEQEPSEDELNGINVKDDGTVSSTGLPDYDSDYDINNSYVSEPLTGASLTDSVKTGFGLLGKNGVLAFFSDYFTYVPDWFFSLIVTSLEIIIAIAIIKLAL